MVTIHDKNGNILLEVLSENPGYFPTPTIKSIEKWLRDRLVYLINTNLNKPIDHIFKCKLIAEVGQYFNSSIEDVEFNEHGQLISIIFHHRTPKNAGQLL